MARVELADVAHRYAAMPEAEPDPSNDPSNGWSNDWSKDQSKDWAIDDVSHVFRDGGVRHRTNQGNTPAEVVFDIEADEGEELEDKLEELVIRSTVILGLLFLLLVVTLRQVQLTAIVIGSVVFALVICLSLFYFLSVSSMESI